MTYIIFLSQLRVSVGEMAGSSFGTVASLHEVFAHLGLEKYVKLLTSSVSSCCAPFGVVRTS